MLPLELIPHKALLASYDSSSRSGSRGFQKCPRNNMGVIFALKLHRAGEETERWHVESAQTSQRRSFWTFTLETLPAWTDPHNLSFVIIYPYFFIFICTESVKHQTAATRFLHFLPKPRFWFHWKQWNYDGISRPADRSPQTANWTVFRQRFRGCIKADITHPLLSDRWLLGYLTDQ